MREFWWSVRRAIGRSLADRFFSRAGTVLMGAHDGGVDHHVFVVVIARQQLENALENAAFRPSAEALVHDLPVTETRRKITPGDSRSVSVKNGFDEQPIVRRIAADMAFTAGQEILDPIPGRLATQSAAWVGPPPSRPPMNHSTADLGIPPAGSRRTTERRSAFDSDPFLCEGLLTEDRP